MLKRFLSNKLVEEKKMNDFATKHIKILTNYKNKWLNLDTKPKETDEKEIERFIKKMYRICGIEKPIPIIWCSSPMSLLISLTILKKANDNKKKDLRYPLAEAIEYYFMDKYWGTVLPESLWKQVVTEVFSNNCIKSGMTMTLPLWSNYRNILSSLILDQNSLIRENKDQVEKFLPSLSVEMQIWEFLLRSTGNLMNTSIKTSGYGPKNIRLASELDFFRFGLNMIKETSQAHPLIELSSNGCWVLPYKQVCWVSRHPEFIKTNIDGKLHSTEDYAVKYQDGWGFYAINGISGSTKEGIVSRLR